jgi:hypothetical protein
MSAATQATRCLAHGVSMTPMSSKIEDGSSALFLASCAARFRFPATASLMSI